MKVVGHPLEVPVKTQNFRPDRYIGLIISPVLERVTTGHCDRSADSILFSLSVSVTHLVLPAQV